MELSKEIDNYYSHFFSYIDGNLFCELLPVRKIVCWLENSGVTKTSPVFVYSKSQIVANVTAYQDALKGSNRRTKLNYAMKANMNPALVAIMRDLNCSVTLVSGLELELAIQLGFNTEHIILNGNGKQEWEIELAVRHGCMLNIDSCFNLKQTISVARRLKKHARILLRVNPDIDPKVHQYICTGRKGTKFGIQPDDIDAILDEIRNEPLMLLIGLHSHIGSTITDVAVFRDTAIVVYNFYKQLKSQGFEHLEVINLGGGLGISYDRHKSRTADPEYNDSDMKQGVPIPSPAEMVAEVNSVLGDDEVALILEPGRSLIGNAGILVSTVLGVKHGSPQNYIVIDGAMTDVIRPALYGAYHHIDLAEPTSCNQGDRKKYQVVGPVCESADFLGKDRCLPTPHEGCLLAVFDTGAYSSSMGSNYNMRNRPADVLVSGDSVQLIRRPDTLADILTPYYTPNSPLGSSNDQAQSNGVN